jgi:pimeloyl-ACP methyl ester carboxylesterase
VPAQARRTFSDPVFLLAGGPGQSATGLAASVMPLFSRLNNRRDIVFVDQRGTGRSAPLDCGDTKLEALAESADPERQQLRLAECLARLRQLPYGDLRFFHTAIAVQDLDAVRRQLGAPQLNLVGVSYGTRVALEYQRQFPQALRRSVLDGVAPPDMGLVTSLSGDSQAVLDAVFQACEGEAACRTRYPTLRADWAALLAGLPRTVEAAHPLTGVVERFSLTREMLLGVVRGPLYAPALAAALPAAIGAAARGDYRALMGMGSLLQSRRGGGLAMGMHLAVVCAEDWPPAQRAGAAPPGVDFGSAGAKVYERLCATMPTADVSAGFYGIARAGSPALLLSGGLDPATPPRHGARVAGALGPLARHVVVPNAGHGTLSLGCMRDVVFRFIDAVDPAEALAVDAGCVGAVPRPPAFLPALPTPTP